MGRKCGGCLNGVSGLMRVGAQLLGIPLDAAPADVVAGRRDVCRECPEATKNAAKRDGPTKGLTLKSMCRECGCNIAAKTRLASEACPLAKWSAISSPSAAQVEG